MYVNTYGYQQFSAVLTPVVKEPSSIGIDADTFLLGEILTTTISLPI